MLGAMDRARALALGATLLVVPATVVSCSQALKPPPVIEILPEAGGDGDLDVEEASSGPPATCAALRGTCVATTRPCPIQITGIGLCGVTSDDICCTGYGSK
jgi:hypothetical protein